MSYKKPDYDEVYSRRVARIGWALYAVCLLGLAAVIVWTLCRL